MALMQARSAAVDGSRARGQRRARVHAPAKVVAAHPGGSPKAPGAEGARKGWLRSGVLAAAGAVLSMGMHAPAALAHALGGGGGSGAGGLGGGNFGGGGGGGGRGSGGGNELWEVAIKRMTEKEEKDPKKEEEKKKPKVMKHPFSVGKGGAKQVIGRVQFIGLPVGPGMMTAYELQRDALLLEGEEFSDTELSRAADRLMTTGLFTNVDVTKRLRRRGGRKEIWDVQVRCAEKMYPPAKSFKCFATDREGNDGTVRCCIPKHIERQCFDILRQRQVSANDLGRCKQIIENWMRKKGYTFGQCDYFEGMDEGGDIKAHIAEGRINKVNYLWVNEMGTPTKQGRVNINLLKRAVGMKGADVRGTGYDYYSVERAKTAIRDLFQTQLFDNVQVVPSPMDDEANEVDVMVYVREREPKSVEAEVEWQVAPGENGRADLSSPVPGGNVFVEHRNMDGFGQSVYLSVSAGNVLQPQEDLGFKLELSNPWYRGRANVTAKLSAFNSRKLSPVFTGGPTADEVPPIWMDRAGVRLSHQCQLNRQSSVTYSLVAQEVSARDESGAKVPCGQRTTATGAVHTDGPPTTHSGRGVDHLVTAQMNLNRDGTRFKNGTLVGGREIFTMDQSVGLGTGTPVFNKASLQMTRFNALKEDWQIDDRPPPTFVWHAYAGNVVGDLAAYDAFTLGGPHSIRGYGVGELGVSRRVVQGCAELRWPLPEPLPKGLQGFVFAELVTDAGGSVLVRGNPTEYYRRAGYGRSAGVGLMAGPVRAEYVKPNNGTPGGTYVKFGSRY
mmetsp:Transcript_503/g.1644  ORF Transcript_503/g.1644 Transcript_503/m.1644 type:complete len:782 (-) Transcript_503:148-2493(-)